MVVEGEDEATQTCGFEMEGPVLRCVWPGDEVMCALLLLMAKPFSRESPQRQNNPRVPRGGRMHFVLLLLLHPLLFQQLLLCIPGKALNHTLNPSRNSQHLQCPPELLCCAYSSPGQMPRLSGHNPSQVLSSLSAEVQCL